MRTARLHAAPGQVSSLVIAIVPTRASFSIVPHGASFVTVHIAGGRLSTIVQLYRRRRGQVIIPRPT